jgi:hypothetical protein
MRRHANYRIPSVDFNCLPLLLQLPSRGLITDRSRVSEAGRPTFSRGFSILAGRASVNVGGRRDRSNGIYYLINVKLQRKRCRGQGGARA